MEIKVIVSTIIVKDNKVLMVKEGKEYCYGQWNIPAGHLELKESLTKAAIREVKEETGYDAKITGLVDINNYFSKRNNHIVRINFIGEICGGDIKVDGKEILDVKWFSFEEIENMKDEELRSPERMRKIIKDYKKGNNYELSLFDEEFI